MFLVVDFSDLNLEYSETDIQIDDDSEFTSHRFLSMLCEGIENLTHHTIPDKDHLQLLGPNLAPLSPLSVVKDLGFCDWDTIYISKG